MGEGVSNNQTECMRKRSRRREKQQPNILHVKMVLEKANNKKEEMTNEKWEKAYATINYQARNWRRAKGKATIKHRGHGIGIDVAPKERKKRRKA